MSQPADGGAGGGAPGGAPGTADPDVLVRRDTVLIIAVRIDEPPGAPFHPGPLVRVWRRRRGSGDVDSSTRRRVGHTDQRLVPLLWEPTVRWHTEEVDPRPSPGGFVLSAVELIRLNDSALGMLRRMDVSPTANGVALLHGSLPAKPPAQMPGALRNCADLDPHHADGVHRAWAADQLPPGCRISTAEREAVYCTLLTARGDLPRLTTDSTPPGSESWSAVDQWLWQMYHATNFPPGPEARAKLETLRLQLPSKVSGVLGLRGLVLVGSEPDPGRDDRGNYYNGATHSVATLYADALALARLHEIVLAAFGAEVARIAEGMPRQRVVAQLERDLLVFRRGYWAADFGRTETATTLLRTWRLSAGLADEVQSLKDDLGELSRQVLSRETEASNAILGLLAAVGLPLSVGLGIWQGLPGSGGAALALTLVITGVTIALLLLVFPGLRRLFVHLFQWETWRE
ncbi:hypothetical protein [Streptomyces sp. NPDC057702]|uniref:hypothetical protein n=1 Tax=unclassified Streptomyces TaxID=2593676 RepID=UPI00367D0F3E